MNKVNKCAVCEVGRLEDGKGRVWRDRRIAIILASGLLLLAGLILHFLLGLHLIAEILFLTTAAITGYDVARKGVYSLIFHKRMPINLLVVTAAVGSFIIGHGEEGAAVLLLFFIAEYLEDYASERARWSIRSLWS